MSNPEHSAQTAHTHKILAAIAREPRAPLVQNEPHAPYGGMKQSGYGRFDGRAVIDQFTEVKWVTIEPSNQPYPF